MQKAKPFIKKDTIVINVGKGFEEKTDKRLSEVLKEELPDNISRRIFVFERASQFELLSKNPETFMWVSPAPKDLLKRYGLIQRECGENTRLYKDLIIHRKDYQLSTLDDIFITELCKSKRKLFK